MERINQEAAWPDGGFQFTDVTFSYLAWAAELCMCMYLYLIGCIYILLASDRVIIGKIRAQSSTDFYYIGFIACVTLSGMQMEYFLSHKISI